MLSKNSKRKSSGQNLVEFALLLPFLMVVLFGVLDLGRIFYVTIGLTSAAREAARYTTLHPDDLSNENGVFFGTKKTAIDEAANSGVVLSSTDVDVVCDNGVDDDADSCDPAGTVVVNITTDFNLVLGFVLPTPITLTRKAEMMVP
ncbi:MAG: pilus assembly protein [Anaerolineales bacterium]|nr:pilus assembly protein [Anaerolineales bacterium]